MTVEYLTAEQEKLEQAIVIQESMRGTIPDDVLDLVIAAIREQLAELKSAQPVEQRKQITVLFADLAGFTTLAEKMDAEDVGQIMSSYFATVSPAISKHGGIIEKFVGDAIMAVFGLLQARENDPENAIRAALEMQHALAELNQRMTTAWGFQLGMRIGINTGPVVATYLGGARQRDFTVVGDTVNLTNRLETAAPVGGVLISHSTYRHVRGIFAVLEQEPLQVKGKVRPVHTYLVEYARPRTFSMLTRGVAGIETRMVGRDAELLMLQNLFRDAMEDAESHVVTVVGDAGVGKSRLLYEFEKWIELLPENIYFFLGRATPATEAMPYGLIRHMFARRFEILESDSAAIVRDKFRAGMAGTLKPTQADLVGQLIGLDFSATPAVRAQLGSESFGEQAAAYLIKFLKAVATEPMVIFLEDLHWADDSSLDLLDRLMTAVPDSRLLVVCLARPSLFERRPNWGEGQEIHTQVNLKPLSRRASRALVGEILQKAKDIPTDLRDLIVEGAEGNPFYVEELIKMLIEDGVILHLQEQWRVELGRLADVRVPSTLVGVLQARLDSLPQEEKTVLQRAAVVGRLFWGALVTELASDKIETAQVNKLLNDMRNRELIFRREYSVFEATEEYIFKHALLRDVTYETVLLKLRRVFHAQAAQWLENAAGERINEYLSLIARHYELAGDTAKAVDFLRRLGEESLKVSAFRESLRAYEQALALLPGLDYDQVQGESTSLPDANLAERAILLVNLGNLYNRTGDYPLAMQHLEQGLVLARQSNDPQAVIEALNRLAQVASERGTYDTAQRYLDEVLLLAREQDDQACVASTLATLSTIVWRWGDLEQAEKCCYESLAIYRKLDDRHGISRMLNVLGILATIQENFFQAEELYEQGLTIAREIDDCQNTAVMLNNLGYLNHHNTQNLTKAKRYYQESLLISREIDHRSGVTSTLNNLGQLLILLGEHQVALQHLRESLLESVAIGAVPLTLDALVGVAQHQVEVGQNGSAAEILGLVLSHPALETDIAQVAKSLLAKVREVLPDEPLEAALARGKMLELDMAVAELEALIAAMLKKPVD